MPLSNISLARLGEVHPELSRRVQNLADALSAEGFSIQIDAALRTAAEQDELYAKGRTMPGARVTNAHGFQSNHVIGCAVDVWCENAETHTADWNAAHPCWQRLVALAPSFGLRDGKSWHDLPHLELAEIPTEPTEAAQQICKTEGVEAVWESLDIRDWYHILGPPGTKSA